jgi:hypothetical protein
LVRNKEDDVFELKFSSEVLLLVVSMVAVALFVGVYLFIVWAEKRVQRKTMECISSESCVSFGEWSSQTVDEIEAYYDNGLPPPRNYPPIPRVCLPKDEVDEEEPTLDMKLR